MYIKIPKNQWDILVSRIRRVGTSGSAKYWMKENMISALNDAINVSEYDESVGPRDIENVSSNLFSEQEIENLQRGIWKGKYIGLSMEQVRSVISLIAIAMKKKSRGETIR